MPASPLRLAMFESKKSLLDTKAAVPYSALLMTVVWSTWGDDAPKNSTPVPPKFFTVNPLTRTGPTGVTRLKLLSNVPWMHRPLTDDGSLGSKHAFDSLVGADAGGCRMVAPWPSPMMLRRLVTSTASR